MSNLHSSTLKFQCKKRNWLLSCHFSEWEDWWNIYIENILNLSMLSHATIKTLRWQSHNGIFKKIYVSKLLSMYHRCFYLKIPQGNIFQWYLSNFLSVRISHIWSFPFENSIRELYMNVMSVKCVVGMSCI